jgi:transposase
MNATTYGVDIAKNVFQLHWIDGQTGEIKRRKIARAKLSDFFAQRQPARIAMEACGGAHHWARVFAALGHRVELLPARLVKAFVVGNKDDAADARAICVAAQQGDIRRVPVVRSHWIDQRTATVNNLRGLLYEFGVALPKGKAPALKALCERRALVDGQLPALMSRLVDIQLETLRQVNDTIEAVERELEAVQKASPVAKRLREVPGIGLLGATALAATLGDDAGGWRSAREFASCLGLTPTHTGTGGKVRVGSISKRGDPYIRTLLVSGAHSIVNNARNDSWIQALLLRRHRNVVVIAVANKLARMAWALVANGRRYDGAWRSQAAGVGGTAVTSVLAH